MVNGEWQLLTGYLVQFYESRTYVFMTSFIIRLSPEPPTPNPAPRGGELLGAVFRGEGPENRAVNASRPLPLGRGAGGMGLPTKPAKDLCKAILAISQPIPHAKDRLHVHGLVGVGFDFLAQVADVHVNGAFQAVVVQAERFF